MKRRTLGIAIAGLAIAGGTFAGGMAAQAAMAPANTSTTTNTLVSPRCYEHQSHAVNDFHWNTAAGRYLVYASPHYSGSHYLYCHA